jgi:gliding motility-associated-like protein
MASFTANKISACRNTAITFTDQSTPISTISKWTFDFGDGAVQTFNAPPFTHTYKTTGTFGVKLTVEDQQGCTNAYALPANILITKPEVGFMADQLRSCPGAPVQFTDTSKGQGLTYFWDFGDGNTSALRNPVHAYHEDNKSFTVKLFITDTSGCVDSVIKVNYIMVKSARAAFSAEDTAAICPPLLTKFNFAGTDYESYYWDFGDGEDSKTLSPDHFYNTYGSFNAKLFVTAFGGCVDSAQQTINVYNPASTSINYTVPPIACNALTVDFTISTPPLTSFTFFYGDGGIDDTQQKNLRYFYGTPSHQTPYLVLRDSLDCQVTISGTEAIRVIGAEPFYSVDRNKFCDSGTVYFTNFTIGNDPVVSDTWDFGDGVTSTDRDPAHQYTQPGSYLFSHRVETQSGCIKSLTDTIRVYRTPDPDIISDDIICINSPATFQGVLAVADTATQWNWRLGNGQTSSNRDVVLAYNRDATYKVELEATNLLGCKGSAEKTITVVPLPVINVPEHPVITLGTGVKLPMSYSPNVQTYTWTPTAGLDCPTCPTPFATPKFNTTYKVNVVDSNGCVNSAEVNVAVVCNDKNYFVPNTFSPNGDGKNDVFYPRGQSIDRIQSMKIFNRWGELVFERRNFSVNSQSDGWNGTYKGKPATSDVYVYIVEFICENATIISYKGNVALIR